MRRFDTMIAIERRLVLFSGCLAILTAASLVSAGDVAPLKAKASPDGQTLWYDCKDLGVDGKGWTDTQSLYDRLPAKAQGKAPAPVWDLSHQSAGLCVRFTTDAPSIQVHWTLLSGYLAPPHMAATGASGVDLYVKDDSGKWHFSANGMPSATSNTSTFAAPPSKQCLLYLPLCNGVKSVAIGVPKGRTISTLHADSSKRRKPIVFYGTSITQGACASRPGMAMTAIVGRQLDTPILNLGFSASGRMEPEMADLLAELDPSVYVLDCLWNMSVDEVANRVEPFVKRLRRSHPETPILLAEDSNFRNVHLTEKGRILRNVYDAMTAEHVNNLHFLTRSRHVGRRQ